MSNMLELLGLFVSLGDMLSFSLPGGGGGGGEEKIVGLRFDQYPGWHHERLSELK